jgi:hypothetical protein
MADRPQQDSLRRASLQQKEAEEDTLSTEIEGLNLVLLKLQQGNAQPSERSAVEKQLANLRQQQARKRREIDQLLAELGRTRSDSTIS